MGAKDSGTQRKLGAVEPAQVITPLAQAEEMATWGAPALLAFLDRAVPIVLEAERRTEEMRLHVGLALWHLRNEAPEADYTRETRRLTAEHDVTLATLWRWRSLATAHWTLGPPAGAAARIEGQARKVRAAATTLPAKAIGPAAATDLAPEPANGGDGPLATSPAQPEGPAGSGVRPVTVTRALDLIAVCSTEELRAAGHVRVRDAVDRLAAADGRKLITAEVWEAYRTAMAVVAAPAVPKTTPPGDKEQADCPHPAGQRQSLPSGIVRCGKCGASKVGSTWRPAA